MAELAGRLECSCGISVFAECVRGWSEISSCASFWQPLAIMDKHMSFISTVGGLAVLMSVCFLPLCDLELYPHVSPIRSSLKTPCYISKVLRGEQ